MKKPNYDVIIPSFVRYDSNLTELSKLLFGEICVLAVKEGYCWSSNDYFAELYKVSESTIKRCIRNLTDNHYISCEFEYEKGSKEIKNRKIYPLEVGSKMNPRGVKNEPRGGVKNDLDNIIQDININNNIEEISNYDWLDD